VASTSAPFPIPEKAASRHVADASSRAIGCGQRNGVFNLPLTVCHQFAAQLHDRRRTPVESKPGSRPTLPSKWKTDSEQHVSPEFRHIGFIDPRQRRERRRAVALAQLIATVALVLSIAVAAVSIGMARASAASTPAALDGPCAA
jgi:hypothetical protein